MRAASYRNSNPSHAAYMRGVRDEEYQRQLFAAAEEARSDFETYEAPAEPIDAFIAWASATLRVPTGPLSGQPFAIEDWQERFLRGAMASGVMEAGLSVARKNGKSGLIAAWLLCHLCGPLAAPGWRGIVVSMTGTLAKELKSAMVLTARISGIATILPYETPPPGRILGERGTSVDFLAADKATGHAIGADIACIDEAGLLPEGMRDLWNAVFSSISGRRGRLFCISIRGDGPMFGELQEREGDPGVYWQEHAAREDAAWDDEEAWHSANPALRSGVKSLDYMKHAAARALASPANAASFAALDLNLPQEPSREMILSVHQWLEAVVETLPAREGPCFVGIDLGGSVSMTAAVAYWPETYRMEVRGAFPATPDLRVRGESDGVGGLYQRMLDRGELAVYPGRTLAVDDFVSDLSLNLGGVRVEACGSDRFRKQEALDAYAKAGVRWPLVWRGQGHSATADGSADVRAFQAAILGGRVKSLRNLVMEHAIAMSALSRDASGNPKIDKAKATGRIDALSAAVIAVGLGERWRARKSRSSGVYHGAV